MNPSLFISALPATSRVHILVLVLSFSSTATSKLILNSIICNPSSDIPETFYPVKNQSTIQPEPMANPQRSNTTVNILGLRALK